MADALASLGRLRRLQEAEARRALGSAIAAETQAVQRVAQARAAPRLEAEVGAGAGAAQGSTADPRCNAFAAWLPRAMQAIADAEQASADRTNDREAFRAALAACRAALKAVNTVEAARQSEMARILGRRGQSRLDEMGQRGQ